MDTTVLKFARPILAAAALAITTMALCYGAIAASKPIVGNPRVKIEGQKVRVLDGMLDAIVTLNRDGTATTFDAGGREHYGMWWIRPDFRVCVALKALWEGGDCGFASANNGGYELKLAPWTPPTANPPLGAQKYSGFEQPRAGASRITLRPADLNGRTIYTRDQYTSYSLAMAGDGTFRYSDEDGIAFRGHYWIGKDGTLCLASRKFWRVGWCAYAHGSGLNALSHLNPTTSPQFWMPAAFTPNLP